MSNPDAVSGAVSSVLTTLSPPPGSLFLAAYSGGADSTALLVALAEDAEKRGWRVNAIHVDHCLRPLEEREEERALVKSLAARLGVKLCVAHVASGAILRYAQTRKTGIEAAARHFRYSAIMTCARRLGASSVFLGHTRDDQLETILMRLAGGSGAGGLKGISAGSGLVVRPLLSCGKPEILAYLERRSIPYSSDSSNESDDYRRNLVRHHIIPAFDKHLPGWRSGTQLTSSKSALDEDAFTSFTARSPGKFQKSGAKSQEADFQSFYREPEALRIRMLLSAAGELSGRSRLSWKMAREAVRILSAESNRFHGGGFSLSASRGKLILKYGLDFPHRGGYFVEVFGPGSIATGRMRIRISWKQTSQVPGLAEGTFSFPLVLRSRLPGDSIHITGGMKKLDELYREWKVPPESRDAIPVVEDRMGIVAVLGSYAGLHDRFRAANLKGEGRVLSILMKGARVSDGF